MFEGDTTANIRVLLADDNEAILRQIEELLTPSFDVVATVPNGALLLKEASRHDPDVIVTDISMPEMSGLDAIRELKAAGSRARVLFLSVFQQPSFVRACFAAGADGYVPKTRLSSDLIHALEEVLAGRKFGANGPRREDRCSTSLITVPVEPKTL